MKKIIPVLLFAAACCTSVNTMAQTKPVKKPTKVVKPAATPKTTPAATATPAVKPAGAAFNTLSFTIQEQNGNKKEISITSAAKKSTDVSDYFNTVRIDKIHTNDNGDKEPVTKLDINNEKNQNIAASFAIPVLNDTGTAVATYETDYSNQINWHASFDGYRLSPENIIITITKWAQVGDFMEGTFTGTAKLIQENHIYDNDNPAPVCTILNGKFRVKRVKDQSAYGGE